MIFHSSEAEGNNEGVTPLCLQPKHAHIPDIALDSNLLFEAMVFVFCLMALGMQYINLYKTVWWLPHSNANYALVSLGCLYNAFFKYQTFFNNSFSQKKEHETE